MSKEVSKIPPPTKKVEVIPDDLKKQWDSVQAAATTVNVIDQGSYPHQWLGAVRAARAFVASIYEQQAEVALKHPQAHMISELKEIQKAQKGESNAKAK